MTEKLVDEKFTNFSAFIKEKATNLEKYKQYDDKEVLRKMIYDYVKPAYTIGQIQTVGDSMCNLLGISDCCDKKKVVRYLEFFSQAL